MIERFLRFADRLSGATGFLGACLVLPLALVMFYEVVLRFFLDLPTFWAYEISYMMTGAHFALGIAYVMREGQHIRIDFLYERFGPKVKAGIDLSIYLFFLLPIISWMAWLLSSKAVTALTIGEVSGESAWNPYVWPVYSVIAFGFVVFVLQIVAETIRCARVVFCGRHNAEH
jgi:TRAP-type mannitol/chloroaromatic compound transport system permease small subunit